MSKHLLDVNVLLASIVEAHPQNSAAQAWLKGKQIVLCPLSELGFLRISTNRKVPGLGLEMTTAREVLERFVAERKAERIPANLDALDSHPRTSDQVTDHYLSDLAAKHGLRLATFDEQLKHPSVELVARADFETGED